MTEQQTNAEINLKTAQANLAVIEAILIAKKVHWYELTLVATGAGGLVALGIALAKIFMVPGV